MELNPNCSEVVLRLDGYAREQVLEALALFGITLSGKARGSGGWSMMEMADDSSPYVPDYAHGATIELIQFDAPDGTRLWLEAFQDSQPQLFPTMDRIADVLRLAFAGFEADWKGSSGSIEHYHDWIAAGRPDVAGDSPDEE